MQKFQWEPVFFGMTFLNQANTCSWWRLIKYGSCKRQWNNSKFHPLDEALLSYLSEGVQSCVRNGMLHWLFQSISISRVSLLVSFFFFSFKIFEWCPDVIILNWFNKIWSVLELWKKRMNVWMFLRFTLTMSRTLRAEEFGCEALQKAVWFTLTHNIEKFKESLVSWLCFRFHIDYF